MFGQLAMVEGKTTFLQRRVFWKNSGHGGGEVAGGSASAIATTAEKTDCVTSL